MANGTVDLTAFMQASNNLERVTRQLRDQNEASGKEIAGIIGNDLKKVTDPFVSSFQQIPGLSTLGSIGKTLFNKTFALRKEKKEQESLRKRLNLTKDQFNNLKDQKKIQEAQKKDREEFADATKNLLGFDVANFNAGAQMFVDERGKFTGGINKLIKGQQEMIDVDLAKTSKEQKGAAARSELENENLRSEEKRDGIFQKISSTLSGIGTTESGEKKGGIAIFGAIGGVLTGAVLSIRKAFMGFSLGVKLNVELFKTTVKEKLAPFVDKLKSFGTFLKTKLTPIGNFLGKIKDGPIGKSVTKLLGLFKVFGKFSPLVILVAAFEGITGAIEKFKEESGGGLLGRIVKSIGGGIANIAKGFIGLPLDLLTKGLGYIVGIFGENFITKGIDDFMSSGGFQGRIKSAIGGLIDGFVDGVTGMFNAAKDFFLGGGFITAIQDIGSKTKGIGGKILSGIANFVGGGSGTTGMVNPMLSVDTNQIKENAGLKTTASQPVIINNVDNSVVNGGGGGGGFIPLPFPIRDPSSPIGTLAAL